LVLGGVAGSRQRPARAASIRTFCAAGPRVARTGPRLRTDYMSTTLLTTKRMHATGFASSLIEGRLRRRSWRRSGEWRPAAAAR